MNLVASVLVAIGGVSFAAAIIYEFVNHKRAGGPVFEGRKHLVFPWALMSFAVYGVGFFMFAATRW